MKKIISLTALSAKITLLVCISAMGLNFGVKNTTYAAPCHQAVKVSETPQKEACETCKIAEKTWDQQFTQLNAEIIKEAPAITVLSFVDTFFKDTNTFLKINTTHDPPDKTCVLNAHLLSKNSIVLVI